MKKASLTTLEDAVHPLRLWEEFRVPQVGVTVALASSLGNRIYFNSHS